MSADDPDTPTWRLDSADPRSTIQDMIAPEPVRRRGLVLKHALGEGGMGIVHLAEQEELGREVAVKRVKGDDPKAFRLLEQEGCVTGFIEHPNVVPVHELRWDDAGRPALVLKRISGVVWQDILDGRAPIPAEGLSDPIGWHLGMLVQVCNAVDFAHSRQILHRDLKPENVMIGEYGEVYLLDWGIAVSCVPHPRIRSLRDLQGLAGTPLFMPSEMFEPSQPRMGPHTDVYMLGAMLFCVLAGHPHRTGASIDALYEQSLRIPTLDESWPEDLRTLLQQSLAPEPGDRPSLKAFQSGLRSHIPRRDALRVLAEATERWRRLEQILDTNQHPTESVVRVHDQFGACRFAVDDTLHRWPENTDARDLRRRIYTRMVEYELDEGSPAAAATLLDQMRRKPPELRRRVVDAVASEMTTQAQLEELKADLSVGRAAGARALLLFAMAAIWLSLPLALDLAGLPRELPRILLQNAVLAVGMGGAALVMWPWVRRSWMNRHLVGIALLSPVMGTALAIGLAILGANAQMHTTSRSMLDATLISGQAVVVDRRIAPGAIGYAMASIATAVWPPWTTVFLVSATVFLVINIAGLAVLVDRE